MELKNRPSARGIGLLLGFLFVFILSACSPAPAVVAPEGDVLDRVLDIATRFIGLAGISALVGVLVSFVRLSGNISDEMAARVTAGINLVAFVILVAIGFFRPDLSLDFLDGRSAVIASIALFVLGLVTQLVTPAPVFRLLFQARVPVLGAVGEEYEARAHYVAPAKNYTIPPQAPK